MYTPGAHVHACDMAASSHSHLAKPWIRLYAYVLAHSELILGKLTVSRNHSLYHVTTAESYIKKSSLPRATHTLQAFSGGRMMKIPMIGLTMITNHAFLLVLLVVGDATGTTDGADMTASVGEKGEQVTIRCLYYCRKCNTEAMQLSEQI